MKRTKRKIISSILAFALIFSMTGIAVLAEEQDSNGSESETGGPMFLADGDLNVSYRTQDEIRSYASSHPASLNDVVVYDKTPVTTGGSYTLDSLGVLSTDTQTSAINLINQIRYIVGLDKEVGIDDSKSQNASAGSFLNYLNNDLNHEPTRPDGVDDTLYEAGQTGAYNANLSYIYNSNSSGNNLNQAIINQVADTSSMSTVGHRRYIIDPEMSDTAFGATYVSPIGYYAVYVKLGVNKASDLTVAWPAQETPVDYYKNGTAWSISIGSNVTEEAVTVKVESADGTTWTFSSTDSSGGYFTVNNGNYGQTGCIIFEPNDLTVSAGDIFTVTITGATSDTISYTVEFFDLEAEEEKADKTELQAEYDADEKLEESDYTVDSWATFKAAMESAKTVLDNEDATQDDVDNALAVLVAAREALEKKVDKDALQAEYDGDKDLQEDDYTAETWSAFKSALDNAAAVLANDNATQDDVDNALTDLVAAREALEKKTEEEPEPEVNKDALQAEYDADEELEESDYTEDSWATFKAAMESAKAVLDNDDATQDDVDNALTELMAAREALEKKTEEEPEPEVNKDALQAEYDDDEELDESDYTEDSWATFKAAMESAKTVLDNEDATQDEVDNALAELMAAREALEKKTEEEPEPEVNKDALQAEYDADEELEESDYTEDSWAAFKTAMESAKAVLDNDDATQDDVDNALTELVAARGALEKKNDEEPEPEKVDKSELQEEYDADQKLDENDYTEDSWATFNAAMEKAKDVLDDEDATQDDVEEALEELKTAKDNLEKKSDEEPEPDNVDKTELKEEYDADEKLEESDYTVDSWATFKAAMEKAKAVLDDEDATQDDVEEALEELKTAKDNLEKKSDEEPVPVPEPDESRDISGSKEWVDDNDKADARPDSITVNLYQNGEMYDSMIVTEADGWAWSWTVPKYDKNGNAYVYTIDEDEVDYYIPSYTNGSFDITNTFVGEEGAVIGSGSGGDNPKTGDTNNATLWLVLMLAGVAGVFGVYRVRKKG